MDRDGLIPSLRGRPGLRLGIMGGAFDPVHMAHLVVAEEALRQFALDQVLFMPAGDAPHKARHVAPPEFRYLLVELATASNPRFSVSRFEIEREQVSYTVDTLEHLATVLPKDAEMFFLIGADAVLEILTWKRPSRVLELCTFVAVTRPGYRLAGLSDRLAQLPSSAAGRAEERVRIMEVPALDISSTMIRERLVEGRTIRYLVPDDVAALIEKSGCYGPPRLAAEVGSE